MKRARIILSIAVSITTGSMLWVQGAGSSAGTTGAAILTQTVDARALGMGDAFTGIKGSLGNLHFNPAGLSFIDSHQISCLFKKGIAEDNFGILDAGWKTPIGTIAGGITYYTAGDILLISTSGEEKTVTAEKDYITSLAYSFNINNIVSFGMQSKMFKSSLVEEFDATAYSFDIGALCHRDGLGYGLVLQNIGSGITYKTIEDPLPLTIRSGIAYTFKDFTVAVDAVKYKDQNLKGHTGVEYIVNLESDKIQQADDFDQLNKENFWNSLRQSNLFKFMIALRAGYKFGYDLDSATMGLGIIKSRMFRLDYGIALMGDFGQTHYASFTLFF